MSFQDYFTQEMSSPGPGAHMKKWNENTHWNQGLIILKDPGTYPSMNSPVIGLRVEGRSQRMNSDMASNVTSSKYTVGTPSSEFLTTNMPLKTVEASARSSLDVYICLPSTSRMTSARGLVCVHVSHPTVGLSEIKTWISNTSRG